MTEPFSTHGPTDGSNGPIVCTRCGTLNPPRNTCVNPKCRSFIQGHQAAVKHGIYRATQPIDIRLTAQELVDGIVSDLGGLAELSTLEKAYVGHISEVSVTLRLLVNDMATRSVFTPAGNVRSVYEQYLRALDRFDRLGQRLGLKRRARQALSLAEYLEARRVPAAPGPVDPEAA